MNTKLLASIAVFALLGSVVSISMSDYAFAAEDKAKTKKDEMKAKADAKKADAKAKADAKKADAKAKADAKKADAKAKKDAMAGKATGKAVSEVTVEMAKGTANNQDCADQCFVPNTVTVAVGGKVTWKNVDTAAHTATASDGSFDTSLVTAGGSASNTFNTAGSYPYMCIVHPWMKGTVNVQ
ncbi:MAG: hypothetical protein HZC29_02040 [Thaumarchaeota archaeon]|nr:hypothetical protein [Nitrososphaerota archaeon]